ncbi:MAG: methyltransferase domain-containing protein [Myxococcales bacterium]|jgi:SAM-dependent methyltransferase
MEKSAQGLYLPPEDKLHMGCGLDIREGWVNVDLVQHEGVDLACDISQGLPFETSVFTRVLAIDLLEHVPQERCIHVMNEIHRVLQPGGVLELHVPDAPGITAFQDPTHVSYWNEETLTYYYEGDRHRERFGVHYGITACFRPVRVRRRRLFWQRFFSTLDPRWLSNFVLDAELQAVK